MVDKKERKNVTMWAAIGVASPIVIVLIGAIITVSVAISQGEYVDGVHSQDIIELKLRDNELEDEHEEDQKLYQERHDQTIKILHRIELKVENKQDR